jgi:hypothetical protein
MIYKGKDPVEGLGKTSEEIFSDERTDQKIRQHFSDINDVITEEDIRNVKTDFHPVTPVTPGKEKDPFKKNESNVRDEEQKPVENEPPIITPWYVLGA